MHARNFDVEIVKMLSSENKRNVLIFQDYYFCMSNKHARENYYDLFNFLKEFTPFFTFW